MFKARDNNAPTLDFRCVLWCADDHVPFLSKPSAGSMSFANHLHTTDLCVVSCESTFIWKLAPLLANPRYCSNKFYQSHWSVGKIDVIVGYFSNRYPCIPFRPSHLENTNILKLPPYECFSKTSLKLNIPTLYWVSNRENIHCLS